MGMNMKDTKKAFRKLPTVAQYYGKRYLYEYIVHHSLMVTFAGDQRRFWDGSFSFRQSGFRQLYGRKNASDNNQSTPYLALRQAPLGPYGGATDPFGAKHRLRYPFLHFNMKSGERSGEK